MKKTVLFLIILTLAIGGKIAAKSYKLEARIVKNGPSVTDTLDDGRIVTYDVSSDDAEQENDEMDKLYDDDIDVGWEGAPEDQNILNFGLRFQNIAIPKGAVIDSAFLVFVAHENKSTEDVAKISIYGEASDFAKTYDMESLITARPKTNAKIYWEVAEDWEMWKTYRTPDIKTIISEIVAREGWLPGNPIALMMLGENQGPSEVENAREFDSFENISDPEEGGDGQNHPERVPMLVVYYSYTSGLIVQPIMKNGESVTDTLDNGQVVTYDVSSDDAEQENDEMDKLYDDDLDAGWEGAPEDQNILNFGLRFANINLPKGARIDSAYIRLVAHENKSTEDVANITIAGEASDNAATYDMDNLITARPRTNATIDWVVAENWDMWNVYRTPDLKDIVSEIVGRQGWNTGNSVAIMLFGENQGPTEVENAREFESFENISDPEEGGDGQNHPERVPRLYVYYSMPTEADNDLFEDIQVELYPNPVSSNLTITFGGSFGNSSVAIMNYLGETVKTVSHSDVSVTTINLESLPAGVYYLNIIGNGKSATKKIVKY